MFTLGLRRQSGFSGQIVSSVCELGNAEDNSPVLGVFQAALRSHNGTVMPAGMHATMVRLRASLDLPSPSHH